MHTAIYHRLDVTIYASDLAVLRALRRKLKRTALTRKNRTTRHALCRGVLNAHRNARKLAQTFRL